MRYVVQNPGPRLAPFVERFWHFHDVPSHTGERVLPSGTVELVINLKDDRFVIRDPVDSSGCSRYSGALAYNFLQMEEWPGIRAV